MKTLFMREKLLYLLFGQRSDYQCESADFNQDLLPYTYREHLTGKDTTDNSIYGKNEIVRFCFVNRHDSGYVCKGLRANREQVNIHPNWGAYAVDGIYSWYVKPRIRIDSAFANNPVNREKYVCRLEVLNFKGDTILRTDIKVRNFLDKDTEIYHGNYLDEYNFGLLDSKLLLDTNTKFNPNKEVLWNMDCQVDFRVFWYKQCDMWIDYVRVDNETAHQLFKGYYQDPLSPRPWLLWEIDSLAVPNSDNIDRIYMEEFEFNQIPCMKYVSDYIKSKNPNFSLMFDLNIATYSAHKEDPGNNYDENHIKRNLYDIIQPKEVFSYSYPLKARYYNENHVAEGEYYIPNTLGVDFSPTNGILAKAVAPIVYDSTLKNLLDYDGSDNHRTTMKKLDLLSKNTNLPLIFMPQGHMVYWQYHKIKEPTNEELSLMTYLGLTYGAKGILHYAYGGAGCFIDYAVDSLNLGFDRGFTDPSGDSCNLFGEPRYINAYGQRKWTKLKEINKHIQKWGDYIMKFDIGTRRTYSYYLEDERYEMNGSTYISELLTYKPMTGAIPCQEDIIDTLEKRTSIALECKEDRYVQAGFFTVQNEPSNRYLMIVNRRCSPFLDTTTHDRNGGRRLIKIRFNNTLPVFNNFKLVDLYADSTITILDKNQSRYVDLDWFMPGEARLYKITPVMYEGGTFAGDENVPANISFNCNGMVLNNGKNLTINTGTTINFKENCGIEMNGGNFICGINADNVEAVTLQKTSAGSGWGGLTLNNCSSVGIYNTFINGVKANDTAKSVSMTNCYNVNLRRNSFAQSNNSGAIQAVYTNPSDETLILNIRECNFSMGPSGYSGVNVISNASMTTPVVIEWCNFTTSNDTSNAVMLTNVTGGAIKNNNLTGFRKSIVALTSAIDIYGNRIIGCNSSYGIQCLSGSDVTMKTVSGYHLGGENYFRNYGSSSACIYSDNSWFDINFGTNNFDLDNINDSKFLSGTLSGTPADNVDATKNCFHKDSVQNIEGNHNMTWYSSSDPVGFTFAPYTCELSQNEDFIVFNYGGYNDTVYYNPGGQGSGFNPNKVTNIEEGNYKSLRDTINLNLRKRNYSVVEEKAKQLLTQYPDSLESVGMVQKLYIASLTLDQNGNKIGPLKTYLENLVSSNLQNPALIKRAFYHIQKCKVKLGQYQSALDGFQYIMTQNPYSYEGLVASWDYAATYLLMGQGGSLSGETEQVTEELNTPADTLLNRMSRNDSKTKTTNDGQKTKVFYEKVKIATKDDKTVQEEKIKQLEKTIESSKSDITKSKAQTELTTMKTIKESVKIKKPNSVKTHVIMINNDIKKIFGIGKGSKTSSVNNMIPKTFELYQNYPNPFNPSTKIAFDLPLEGKVKLVIYDILGRQIKTLVDNELRTSGKYTIEFNGSNLASGIYFYRLQVEGGKTFTAVKKMVFIK